MRYIKTDKNPDAKNDWFVAWDDARHGELSEYATHAQDVGKPMNATDSSRFNGMAPGEVFLRDGYEYFRAW